MIGLKEDLRELPAAETVEFRAKRQRTVVIIPVLNEGDRIKNQLENMRTLSHIIDVVICDGGSTDGCCAPSLLRSLGVKAAIYKTGPGRMSSQLRLLFDYALSRGYEYMIHMDGNEKDDPVCLPSIIGKLEVGYDLVAVSRFLTNGIEENTPIDRKLAIRLVHSPIISIAAGFWFTDTTNSYRGYSSKFIADPQLQIFRNVFDAYNLPYYLLVRASRLKYKCCEIPGARRYKRGELVSKIRGFSGKWSIFKELYQTALGYFDP